MTKAKDLKTLYDFSNRVNESLFRSDWTYQSLMRFVFPESEATRVTTIVEDWDQYMPSWNTLADEAARPEKLPRLEVRDRVGNAVERVMVPLETRLIRHRVVEAGIFKNQSELEKFSKVYLLSQIGESGVTCPLACTDGLIRVLKAKGSDFLKNKYLDQIQSSDQPLAGAQFVTETTGGSDIGAIESRVDHKEGEYFLHGKKWYCSTPEEFFLVAARPNGAPEGTKGVGIYFVPRMIANGVKGGKDYVPNHYSMKRLKDKFGTQSLPTAEIDFEGSHAYPIGYEGEGFVNLMTYVINCSRLHNSANAMGFHRRAFVEARNYAEQRGAFGDYIIKFPLVAEHLVSLQSHLAAKEVLFLKLLQHVDANSWEPKDQNASFWQRFLINMCKYRTSHDLVERVKEAILVFGANGVMNDFSILPRLMRDAMVLETWEGTHNTLCLQIMRDLHKFDLMDRLYHEIENILNDWPQGVMTDSRKFFENTVEVGKTIFTSKNLYDPNWSATHARRFVDHFGALLETGWLMQAGVKLKVCNFLMHSSYLTHKLLSDRFSGFESPAIEYLTGVCQDLIREVPIDIDVVFKHNERMKADKKN